MRLWTFQEWFCLIMGLALLATVTFNDGDLRIALLPLLALVRQFVVRKAKPK